MAAIRRKVLATKISAPHGPANSALPPPPLTPVETDTKAPRKSPVPKWLEDDVFKRIEISGNRELGFHATSVSGDTDSYQTLNNYGNGGATFTDHGSMTIQGRKVLDVLTFQVQFQDNRLQDPDSKQLTLEYDRGPLKLTQGDTRGTLINSNPFASFSKSMKGTMADYQKGRTRFKAIHSETKGSARTVSIQGANSPGPYFLQSGLVIGDTVEVSLDGQTLSRGQDFLVDATSGSITFLRRVVVPTSTIVVTYEARGFGETPGIIDGVSGQYNFGSAGRLGLTAIRQRTGTGVGGNNVVEAFQGYAAPSTYTISNQPVSGTVVVYLDGRPLLSGVEYTVSTLDPRVFIVNVEAGSQDTITITYRPVSVAGVSGDREVLGLDYRLELAKQGYVQYSQALGQSVNTDSPSRGLARGIVGEYQWGAFKFSASARNVPPEYVTVESLGFSRNELANNLGVEWHKDRFAAGISNANSLVSNTTLSATGSASTGNARATSTRVYSNYSAPDGTNWSLEQKQTGSSNLGVDSTLDSTSLVAAKRFGRLRLNTGLDLQNGQGLISNGTTSTPGSIHLGSIHLGAGYSPSDVLSFNSRVTLSETKALDQVSKGTDVSIDSSWRPSPNFSLTASNVHSRGGEASFLSSFSTGSGFGYGGNGFSAGTGGSGYLGAGGDLDRNDFTTEWRVSPRFYLNGHYNQVRSVGSLSANSDVHTVGFGTEWDLGKSNVLSTALDRSSSSYIGSTTSGSTSATTIDTSFAGSPKGSWSYHLGLNMLLSGGISAYAQDSLNYDASLAYRLDSRQRLIGNYQTGRYTGYYGQNTENIGFDYEYELYRGIRLLSGYHVKTVSNVDPTLTAGAYRAAGLDIQLIFGFAR